MIEVTENDNGTFTISWDENDPLESVFNDWTEKDWIKMLTDAADEIFSKKEYYEGKEKVNPTETRGESQNPNISEATQKDWEDFWNSESEGRDKDKDYDQAYEEYISAKDNHYAVQEEDYFFSPEAQGSWD